MANIKDFAAGIVVTPPSPATSGTSLTLRTGDGASMPTPPFYVTATPPGQLTTLGTSEKLLVTAVSTDTLTIVRAQSPTTAKSIDANWIVANAMYVDDVMKSNIVIDEQLSGTVNGTNKIFTTNSTFSSIQVWKNGTAMHLGTDFTVTGTNQITFVTAPSTGIITATYIIGSSVMIYGSNSLVTDEIPSGTKNGSNTSFTTIKPYVSGSLEVFVNGVKQARGSHFSESSPTTGGFTISDAPVSTDNLLVNYQYSTGVTGNAQSLNGYSASTSPTANTIPVLDSNGFLPSGVPVRRQNNTTNTNTPSARIETGVGLITNSSTKAVTFATPFINVPIIVASISGGDGASSTFAYPMGTGFNDRVLGVQAQSTTGFTAIMSGTAPTAGQGAIFTWIAIGV